MKPSKYRIDNLFIKKSFLDASDVLIKEFPKYKNIKFKNFEFSSKKTISKIKHSDYKILVYSLYIVVLMVNIIHFTKIKDVINIESNVLNLLKDLTRESIDYHNKISSEELKLNEKEIKIIDSKIFASIKELIQKEKKSSKTHENITSTCSKDRYIIKYNINGNKSKIRICICVGQNLKLTEIDYKKTKK